MKKLFCLFSAVFMCSAFVSADGPEWLFNSEKVFPSEQYIKGIGEGPDMEAARKAAVAEISAFFSQTISTQTQASNFITKDAYGYSQQAVLEQKVTTASQTELMLVQFSDGYFDRNLSRYFICAYINRAYGWKVLSEKMENLILIYGELAKTAETEKDSFRKILTYQKMETRFCEFNELYNYSLVLLPEKNKSFDDFILQAVSDSVKLFELKKETTVGVTVEGDRQNRIQTILCSLLYENGITTVSQNEDYRIQACIFWNENQFNEIYSASPEIQIKLTGPSGTVISFYTGAETSAVYNPGILEQLEILVLEEALKKHFIQEFFYGGNYE